jgi:hypothetical protein
VTSALATHSKCVTTINATAIPHDCNPTHHFTESVQVLRHADSQRTSCAIFSRRQILASARHVEKTYDANEVTLSDFSTFNFCSFFFLIWFRRIWHSPDATTTAHALNEPTPCVLFDLNLSFVVFTQTLFLLLFKMPLQISRGHLRWLVQCFGGRDAAF